MKNKIVPGIILFLAFLGTVAVILASKTQQKPPMIVVGENQEVVVPKVKPKATLKIAKIKPKTYAEVVAAAREQGKDVFLFFESDWCHWCKKMEVDTLAKPQTKKALSQYLVYHVNTEKEQDVAARYRVQSVPAYFVINGQEQVLKSGAGYKGEAAFILWLNSKVGDMRVRRIAR